MSSPNHQVRLEVRNLFYTINKFEIVIIIIISGIAAMPNFGILRIFVIDLIREPSSENSAAHDMLLDDVLRHAFVELVFAVLDIECLGAVWESDGKYSDPERWMMKSSVSLTTDPVVQTSPTDLVMVP
jgi:hypothetical protein